MKEIKKINNGWIINNIHFYSKKEFKEALKKVLVLDDNVLGVPIIKKPHEGDWFDKICNDIFKHLN